MKKARNDLSVLDKVAVAKELQAGATHASLVLKYETSKGTVGRISEKRQQWLDLDIECMDKKRKRIEKKKTPDEIENKLLQFIHTCREKNCIVTGPILQAMALRIAKDITGQEGFKASNGWLEAFRVRHHIVSRVLSGERASAPVEHAEDYKANTLPEILSQYEPCQVLNADEIGLYWEQTGRKTLIMEDADKAGAKISKKRITILLTAAMDGSLVAMEVINQYLHPRAFSAIKQDLKRLLPCISWSASKKGWMTSEIFHNFLVKVNEKFRHSNSDCVLFLDNFRDTWQVLTAVLTMTSNTRIEWLPAHCTSIYQPIDMGIGQAFKLRYRKFLHEHMCNQVFADRPPTTGLDLMRVCVWLSRAWNSLNGSQTVQRCFIKAGFIMTGEELIPTEESPEDPGTNEVDLLAVEAKIADPPIVEDHEKIINEVLEQSQANDVTVLDEEPDVVMNDCEPVHVITARAATQALLDLEIFFQDQGKQFDAEWCAVHADEVRKVAEMLQKQTKISQFFSQC